MVGRSSVFERFQEKLLEAASVSFHWPRPTPQGMALYWYEFDSISKLRLVEHYNGAVQTPPTMRRFMYDDPVPLPLLANQPVSFEIHSIIIRTHSSTAS